jgi:Cu/Ag efflux pump CusA
MTTAVGMLAVLGLAIRFAVVFLRRCEELRLPAGGKTNATLVRQAAGERVVPVVVTTAAVLLLLLPALAMGDVAGLEVVRPAVAVLFGGLITSALTTLFVLPPLYLALAPEGLPSGDDDPEGEATSSPVIDRPAAERQVS